MVEISIIVPIYNCEKYLERCLESIRGQVFQNWEAILVDDGSTDRSGDICDLYADRDPRFSVIHQENKGASIARMEGARLSKGKYLGFVDSDDWISPEMYRRMYDEGRKHDADMVLLSTAISETENDMLKRRLVKVPAGLYDRERMEKEIFPDALSDGGFFTHSINCAMTNKLFRRECLMPYILHSEGAFIMRQYLSRCFFPVTVCMYAKILTHITCMPGKGQCHVLIKIIFSKPVKSGMRICWINVSPFGKEILKGRLTVISYLCQ